MIVRCRPPDSGVEFLLAELGMIDLRRYAARLLTEGLTSIEEVTSAVSADI
jgi:hypothetical protein